MVLRHGKVVHHDRVRDVYLDILLHEAAGADDKVVQVGLLPAVAKAVQLPCASSNTLKRRFNYSITL